jgi:two-component system, OmpR family, sensor histidine kinase KdpD
VSISARIEHVRSEDLLDEPVPTERAPRCVGRRRQLAGLLLATAALALLTLALTQLGETLSLEGQVLLYLLAVVMVALVGGIVVALLSAVAAALAINWWFVEPKHTLDVAHADQLVALVVFVAVAAIVSGAVELAARRARVAEQASEQAETLSALARADHAEQEGLHAILEQARAAFGMESVSLKVRERGSGVWADADTAGWAPAGAEAPLRFDVPVTPSMRLVGRGPALFAEDQRVLAAFAGAAQTAYEGRRLGEQARHAESLASVDRQRTALLAAVGHDLRTPLAGIKAAVSSLRQSDVSWSVQERDALLATIEESADRLDAVVGNLLDASRLEAGAMSVHPEPVALDEIVSTAILAMPIVAEQIRVAVPDDLPLVRVDRGLLERVLVNLLDNALRHGASEQPVEVRAFAGGGSAKLEIADHGPGVSPAQRERLFEPFGRLDDRSTDGVGLGLAVARGLLEAMDGALVADATPGGGLTMRLRVPLAT